LGPQREEGTVIGRIVGLLVVGLVLVSVGISSQAPFWLGIVGLVLFVATGFVAVMHPTVDPVEPPAGP
jgi:protein-S-isoprenylcysteine O-methyltransferase Ste14